MCHSCGEAERHNVIEIGRTKHEQGQHEEALWHIERALALSPTDPVAWAWYYWSGIAAAHLGDYSRSLELLLKSGQANPRNMALRPWLAITYAALGRDETAGRLIREHLAEVPSFNVADWMRRFGLGRDEIAARLQPPSKALLELGVPASKP